MQTFTLNESFKALVREALPDKSQSEVFLKVFDEVINDRATTQRIGLDELKSRAIDEIKDQFVTKDFLRAEIADVRSEIAEVRTEIAATKEELRTEIEKSKVETIKWVIGIQFSVGALIVAILKFF